MRVLVEDIDIVNYKEPVKYCNGCSLIRVFLLPYSLLVQAIMLISYIPYVLQMNHNSIQGFLEMFVFHLLLLLVLVSQIQCALVDPGTVPQRWHDSIFEADPYVRSMVPICQKCQMYKPPRSHFDSITQRLVLNMDHFCPWVANTIGFYNRKFFILFLFYGFLSFLWFLCAVVPRVYIWKEYPTNVLLSSAIIIDFSLCIVLGFFLLFHLFLVAKNRTSIELSEERYDIGLESNIEQVFGKNKLFYFIPIYGDGPHGDGVTWPTTTITQTKHNQQTELL
eukprot:c12360_g2_i1.p1 GENE.c12360_g2_i1~~c12360_g2_i1.p1  ORF type:complete len:286 (-),score=77.42 c12360_g2_i1:50-886(-)